MRSLLLLAALAACGTRSNPLYCGDNGTCSDPERPFCDVDGTIGGQGPFSCIAVDCTPGELIACRDDVAVMCTVTGDDVDERHCESGCVQERGGCVQCVESQQCAVDAPVCDLTTNACVKCTADAECSSLVCDMATGSCKPADEILYASVDGVTNQTCHREIPCSLEVALSVADSARNTIRLLDGIYTHAHVLAAGKSVSLIGNAQTILGMGAQEILRLKGGASAYVRGIKFDSDNPFEIVSCCAEPHGRVVLDHITSRNLNVNLDTDDLEIRDSYLDFGVFGRLSASPEIKISRSTLYEADPAQSSTTLGPPKNGRLSITDSVLYNVFVTAGANANDGTTYRLEMSFDTLVSAMSTNYPSAIYCTEFGVSGYIENSIVYSDMDVVFGQTCRNMAQYNVLFPQTTQVPSTNIIASPDLKNVPTDFHLNLTSPAVDAAMPIAGRGPAAVDLSGTSRPQGPKFDIGALEFAK